MDLKRIKYQNNDEIVIRFNHGKSYEVFWSYTTYECGFSDSNYSSRFLTCGGDQPEEIFKKVWGVILDSINANNLSYFEIIVSNLDEQERNSFRLALTNMGGYHITEYDGGFYANSC